MAFHPPPLTDAQVQAGALPGETWDEARFRLESANCFPGETCNDSAAELLTRRSAGYPAQVIRPDQLEALRVFQQLSPRAQFEHWLQAQGRAWPIESVLKCPSLADLVAMGKCWVACEKRLPHEDNRGRLRYLVYVPDFKGWLHCCRYVGEGWECVSDGSLLSGVTHWRIAFEGEQVGREASWAELP